MGLDKYCLNRGMNGDTVHSGITRVVSKQAVYGHGIKHLAIDT